ncbi:unnamed protein product [Penicillium pancosmium]
MSGDMDDALQKILSTLGMTEPASTVPSSNNPTTKPPSMDKINDYTLLNSTTPPNVVPLERLEDWSLNQQHAIEFPVTGQGHHLPGLSLSSISQQNGCPVVALEDDQSLLTEKSPGSVSNPWLFDLDFGTDITAADVPPAIEAEATELVDSESGSNFTEEPAGTFDIEALVDEISDRIGTIKIDDGGKTRFYGPTSTFNLREIPLLDSCEANSSPPYHSEPEGEVPIALERHLLDLYFSWQDPSFHVVDRSIYEEAKAKCNSLEATPFYSEALRNSMCALGSAFECRYHPTMITFPKTLVEFFGDRAKSILETELESPSVATIQALVILSFHEIGNGKDTRGWLYSGSALRLAFDLALHLDMSSHVSARVISAAHANLRRTVFWTAYVVDQYGTSSISKETLQELNAKIVAKLRKWKSTLPPVLQINLDDVTSPYLPHVLILQA